MCDFDVMRTRASLALSRLAAVDPVGALIARRQARTENGVAPLVIFVVLIAFLALLAAAISVAVLIFCSQKGMNFEWWIKTSWFEIKVACRV